MGYSHLLELDIFGVWRVDYDVARARGMSKVADDTKRGRESLYKSLA